MQDYAPFFVWFLIGVKYKVHRFVTTAAACFLWLQGKPYAAAKIKTSKNLGKKLFKYPIEKICIICYTIFKN